MVVAIVVCGILLVTIIIRRAIHLIMRQRQLSQLQQHSMMVERTVHTQTIPSWHLF